MRRGGSQRGTALVEFSWLAIVLIIPTMWMLLAVFDVQRASFALTSATRAAGRAYVLADTDRAGERAAEAALAVAFTANAGEARNPTLRVSCRPSPRQCHSGTSVVTVRVSTSVSLPWLPKSWGLGSPSFALDATHSIPVGQYQELAGGG